MDSGHYYADYLCDDYDDFDWRQKMNTWNGVGRFTADPELKTTKSGKAVTTFCIAVDKKYGRDEKPNYIDCVAWEKRAETICKHFHKGKMIAVTGELETRMYEDKQGKSRKAVEVRVDEFSFCGDKDDKETAKTSQTGAESVLTDDEGELPF